MTAPPCRVLDVLGSYCPVPVIETRRVIRGLSEPLELMLLTDDPEALHDIPTLLERTGGTILSVKDHEPRGWCMTLLLKPQNGE
ncbi:MAG TPA: sulfurtransferase TusA family protein [Candidatus Poseidoniales archaeon]|nr:sulfurtransferase TusA family protein [Candidatus Poseidoniales archaeon]